jgi:bacteriocin biosynthesis cyclodehydratase domain-containing protein
MSHHLPRTRAARPALRRSADRVQFGLDPSRAITVEGLSDVASAALLRLDGTTPRVQALRLAPELDQVLDALEARGALDDERSARGLSELKRRRHAPDIAALALDRASTAAAERALAARHRSVVAVRGNDRAAALVAVGLAAAGIGTVALEGPDRETGLDDLTPVGPFEPHVSWRDAVAESVRRQGAHPVALRARPRPPAVTVVCSAADADLPWCDPELTDDLLADDLVHLPVAVSADGAVVGPMVVPGAGPCLWCLDRRACDRDAAWPALTDQLRLRHAVSRTQSMPAASSAAAAAVAQVLARIDGSASVVTLGAQLVLRGPEHLVAVVPVTPHPVCGCGWDASTRTIGA